MSTLTREELKELYKLAKGDQGLIKEVKEIYNLLELWDITTREQKLKILSYMHKTGDGLGDAGHETGIITNGRMGGDKYDRTKAIN